MSLLAFGGFANVIERFMPKRSILANETRNVKAEYFQDECISF